MLWQFFTTQQFKTVVLWKLSQHNSFKMLCCEKVVTTQHFKTVVLWLGLGKRWPLCTTVVIDSFLNCIPYSIVHWIQNQGCLRPHVRLDEVDVLFFHRRCAVLLKCPFVMTEFCLDVRQQAIFQDDSSLVGAVDLCASTELIWKFEQNLKCYTFENCSIDISSSVVFC